MGKISNIDDCEKSRKTTWVLCNIRPGDGHEKLQTGHLILYTGHDKVSYWS